MDQPSSILYITLGCAKNEVDTDRMRSLLCAAGYEEADGTEDADLVIINTCSFLASATSESIETTLELADEVHEGVRSAPIVMCGCVPSRYGADLPDELPEVAAFVRTDEEDGIVGVVDELLGHGRAVPAHVPDVKRTVEGAVAYLKISDGCDRFCSFCAIPYIRGRYRSRSAASILAEARELVAGGVRELVLIGQDTGIWGNDLPEDTEGPRNLAQLLEAVAAAVRPERVWIRVLYLQPEGMTDELIAAIRDTPEVLPYIDIPVQHCSERVLSAMNRSGSESELEKLFARLRDEIPGMVIRTTYLAAFPGETAEEHEEMLAFMDRIGFDYTSVFAYSREDGTRAARMDEQIPEEEKLERTQAAIDLAEALGFAATASHVGETAEVIVDGIEETEDGPELIGHAWFQAPDCDGAVHLDAGEAAVGDILTVEFTDSFCYELIGHVIDKEATHGLE
ncbi:30S ribosomal protein S12 methylthiotransferase RimO [Collinsella tanakaei]|uniref:30S ribosomal protein S12 methylthiotransferase RimO n=1 Tax=Collinsella tanakaei TaxID=626935 RepID=UPI00195D2749|nr:30S ribosomal protein S12 methylthiotransferase RimO [Collinsella tanakaei]MBM6778125.1 30S ribosomal protein S12 methylthiotransferase RimO [Collinsella tanakaei]